MKKIKCTLNTIGEVIKEVEVYKGALNKKMSEFINELVNQGAAIAANKIISFGAFDSGELSKSIKTIMYVEDGKGIIFTDCPYAAFVEFGTGIVGRNSPHLYLPWKYDVNNHGNAGWVYYDAKQARFRFTKGMSSRPFMYSTIKELAEKAANIARQVFSP